MASAMNGPCSRSIQSWHSCSSQHMVAATSNCSSRVQAQQEIARALQEAADIRGSAERLMEETEEKVAAASKQQATLDQRQEAIAEQLEDLQRREASNQLLSCKSRCWPSGNAMALPNLDPVRSMLRLAARMQGYLKKQAINCVSYSVERQSYDDNPPATIGKVDHTQGELAVSEGKLKAGRDEFSAQKAALEREVQACQTMRQENAATEQRLAQESQDWSAGEAQRREAARRAATAEAELELLDVSCTLPCPCLIVSFLFLR